MCCLCLSLSRTHNQYFHCPLSGSALIHDVDHVGVSNAQLVKEGDALAELYNGRSVAEQNSLDLSWDLLMGPDYDQLRDFLFPHKEELVRFRQLVVNVGLFLCVHFFVGVEAEFNLTFFLAFVSFLILVRDEHRHCRQRFERATEYALGQSFPEGRSSWH